MNKVLTIILLLLANLPAIAQFEPTEEDIAKYAHIMQRVEGRRIPDEATIKMLDSLYALDSNSLFLKGVMGEVNARLIYDSLRTERIPQQITILKYISSLNTEKDEDGFMQFNLMQMYRLAGNYDAAATIARQLLSSPDDRLHDDGLSNILLIYMADGNYKKALEQVKSTPYKSQNARHSSYLAEVYYNNNLYDSALRHADTSIEGMANGKKFYGDYVIKAKIAFKKKDKAQACENIKMAEEIVSKDNAEDILRRRDQNNRHVKEFLKEIEEIHTLNKQYCK